MLVLGLPALVSSYMRIREIGWIPTMAFHTAAVLIALMYMLGSGILFYVIAVVLVTVIYGVPVGIAAWSVCTLSIGAAFVGLRLG